MKVCGLDECGRGAFAGPLVAAGVIISSDIETFPDLLPAPLRDSKKLTEIQRNKIYAIRRKLPIRYVVEEISVEEINSKGIGWANKIIFERLASRIKATVYIVDGNIGFSNRNMQSLVKGDDKCYQVMMASILAKVYRDNLLKKLHRLHPYYGWDQNSGYGSPGHIRGLRAYGVTPHHRTKYVDTALSKDASCHPERSRGIPPLA